MFLIFIIAMTMFMSGCQKIEPEEPSFETDSNGWRDAYAEALLTRYKQDMDDSEFGGAVHFMLLDINADSTPELLFSYLGTANSVIFFGYTYADDEVKAINFTENEFGWLPQELELYRNKETDELQWISHSSFRDGVGYYVYYHSFFDFTNLLNPVSETFCAYGERFTGEGEDREYILFNDGGEEIVSLESIGEQYSEVMSAYQSVTVQEQFVFVSELLGGKTGDNFDLDKLYAFFDLWS